MSIKNKCKFVTTSLTQNANRKSGKHHKTNKNTLLLYNFIFGMMVLSTSSSGASQTFLNAILNLFYYCQTKRIFNIFLSFVEFLLAHSKKYILNYKRNCKISMSQDNRILNRFYKYFLWKSNWRIFKKAFLKIE